MKTTTVNVQIQLDNPDNAAHDGVVSLSEALKALDAINKALQKANLNCQPQILTSGIDDDDIG